MKKAFLLAALILGTGVMVNAKTIPVKNAVAKEVKAPRHPRVKKARKAKAAKAPVAAQTAKTQQ